MANGLVEPKTPTTPPVSVQPANGAAPAPAPAAAATESEVPGLPSELIQIPAIQALVVGQPAAVSANIQEFAARPEGKLITQNKDSLVNAGMGLYRSLSGELGVIFNQFHLHPDELMAADKAGKLLDLAPPFDQVNQMLASAGPDNPVLKGSAPTELKAAPGTLPPQAAIVPPQQAAQAGKQQAAQMKNLQPGSPTSGAKPGAGRILNNILKPVL